MVAVDHATLDNGCLEICAGKWKSSEKDDNCEGIMYNLRYSSRRMAVTNTLRTQILLIIGCFVPLNSDGIVLPEVKPINISL